MSTAGRFAPPLEAKFRESRTAALAEINATNFWLVALLVLGFSLWDRFVDPAHWTDALTIRALGTLVVLGSGIVQLRSRRVAWAPMLARVRYTAAVLTVAGALAVIEGGFVLGLAGLVSIILSGPYIAIDRRDVLALNAVPLVGIAAIMAVAGLERFVVVNTSVFVLLAVAVSLLLARVFEAANRRAFALELDLTREARTDALTGLLNRRALDEVGRAALERSAHDGAPLSVVLGDVDHFKELNDRHGHAAGDRAIRAIAQRLRGALRDTDAVGRWGGEEFLAILPDTDAATGQALAQSMRQVIEHAPLLDDSQLSTVSFGVAVLDERSRSASDPWGALVKAADEALYRAKSEGRNRVVVAIAAGSGTPASPGAAPKRPGQTG